MELMSRYPDKHFDLAIVDPPYGLGKKIYSGGSKGCKFQTLFGENKWDNETPKQEYFNELFRVSKNQIIWGGNYFDLPPTRTIICWDKLKGDNNFSMWEMAWTSFDEPAKIYRQSSMGDRIHPTQKPVALYKWLLDKYAKIKCDHKHEEHYRYLCTDCNNGNVKILDTHLGSGSIAIACHDYGFDLTACELDLEYYNKAMQRIQNHISQTKLF
jgi:site-specific DNA-methyltransferase (adenine-specific)